MTGALEAVRARRSWSKVTDVAPSHQELLTLVSAAGRVADHSSMRPWRLIELRGADRDRLGRAINKANGDKGSSSKPLRAPLLIAVDQEVDLKLAHVGRPEIRVGVAIP